MQRRTERSEVPLDEEISKTTRTKKNQYLYDDINSKIGYEEIVSLDTQTRIDLSNLTGINTNREEYQKVKEYKNLYVEEKPKEEIKRETLEEKKDFDINNILEEARKNRTEIDELEKKRRIKNKEYLDIDELNKIKNEKVEVNGEELKGLIEEINTRDLSKDLEEANNKDLLEDLIATSKIDAEVAIDELEEKIDDDSEKEKMINSFYTSSMELSKGDFENGELLDDDEKPRSKLLIFLIIILLIGVLVAGYLFIKKEGLI